MRIGVPRETAAGERRVALVPEVVAKLVEAGHTVVVERGAGSAASFADAQYEEAGATLADSAWDADAVVKVQKPTGEEAGRLRSGAVLIGFLQPLTDKEGIDRLAAAGVIGFAMESVPRITRAQSMDALSSQATVSGYKAALIAADTLPRFLPMLTTAAGTVQPAKVLVIGAGVAGLQAIATVRRLGAVVHGFDVRDAVREQIESLGAKFLDLGVKGEETAGGYAAELTPEQQAQQQAELEKRLPDYDAVITTAAIPGRPAPKLIPASAVHAMRPGSVIVDLAAETGGNCELTRPGEEVDVERRHHRRPAEPAERDALPREPALRPQRPGAAQPSRARGRARARLRGRDHRRARASPGRKERCMNPGFLIELTVLILAAFLGVQVISKVPALLHTPLMSGTNAIHGIVIVGAIIVAGQHGQPTWLRIVSLAAVALATGNVVGGFVVTDRMLEMFKPKKKAPAPEEEKAE